uniref:Uncharacterized protein n=1 Tax=Beihai levi-like virus 5 TaxID=1922423 RepID=A0A1L3KHX2_9VIRU|nr:hypothetical protein [Beihai levi-like virus 5]
MTGEGSRFGYKTKLNNAVPDQIKSKYISHLSVDTSGWQSMASAMANTNPSRPEVNVPLFLYELKDLPSMIRHVGRRAESNARFAGAKNLPEVKRLLKKRLSAKQISEDYLAYQFGWAPMIRDLLALTGVQDLAAERQLEINSHRVGPYLRYKRTLGSGTNEVYVGSRSVLAANPYQATGACTKRAQRTDWGTITWKPTWPKYRAISNPSTAAIYRAVLGLDIDFSLFWEAMPWSWLVDWCADIGDALSIRRNTVGYSFRRASYCSHHVTEQEIIPWGTSKAGPFQGGDSVVKRETKYRVPWSPSLTSASLPFLGERQLMTLAALTFTR